MHFHSILALILYIVILISIGIFSARRARSSSGYILGDRNLNYWVAAISANASDMSVWLFMGLPMAIYVDGLIHIWMAMGLILFMFLNWHFIAPKLRAATEESNSLTIFSFFETRFKQKAHAIRIVSALISTVFLVIYVAAGVTGMGYLFESIFGISYVLGCVISVFAVLIYITMGGFTAICYTDFAQGIFLLFVILLVPILILFQVPGSVENIPDLKWAFYEALRLDSLEKALGAITMALGWGIGYFGQPHILNKFMAIKNVKDLKKSKWIGTSWQILALSGAVLSGIAAHYFFSEVPLNPEILFVDMVKALFNPFMASFILCAILAATLSTVDSQILVIASVMAEDIYLPLKNYTAKDKSILLISRISAISACLLALILAMLKNTTIFSMVHFCWVGIGSSFGPLVIASLYFKHLNQKACLLGMCFGLIVSSIWLMKGSLISPLVPGFLVGFTTIYFASRYYKSNKKPT